MKRLLVAICLFVPASMHAMPIIDANMQLIGFTNIDVNGTLYNVTLDTGTCVELYSGCDEVSDLPFSVSDANTAANAMAASISDPQGDLISEITSIQDCTFTCFIAIADGLQGSDFTQTQFSIEGPGGPVGSPNRALGNDSRSNEVFAIFTPVPEPATALMLALGLTGVSLQRRTRKDRSARTPAG